MSPNKSATRISIQIDGLEVGLAVEMGDLEIVAGPAYVGNLVRSLMDDVGCGIIGDSCG